MDNAGLRREAFPSPKRGMEPGSDEAYRTQLEPKLVYQVNNP